MIKKLYLFFVLALLALLGSCSGNNVSSSENTSTKPNISSNPVESTEEENVVNVIILCGQSNAEGHTHSNMLMNNNPQLYKKYLSSDETKNQIIYNCDSGHNVSETFKSIKLGQGFNISRFGPEIGINEAFEKAELKRPVYIMKYTVGATDLYTRWRSPSSGNPGDLYTKMVNFVYEQLGNLEYDGITPYVKGICFMQGEADSCDNNKTAAYETYINNFITDLVEELYNYQETPDETIKFVDAGISDCSTWVNYATVNQAKKKIAESDPENRYFIDTIAEKLEYNKEPSVVDYFHYDSLSMIKLGELFGEALLSFGTIK